MINHKEIDSKIELNKLYNQKQDVLIIGALDGVKHEYLSPMVLENSEWNTIFVEPVKKYFLELKNNYGNKRNNIFFENSAITEESKVRTIYKVDPNAISNSIVPTWCDGISSFYLDKTILATIPQQYLVSEQVNCITINDLCNKYNITNIDILQIDTEGYDFFILKEIFSNGYRPKLIYLEIVNMSQDELKETQNLLSFEYSIFIDKNNSDNIIAIRQQKVFNNTKKPRFAFYIETKWAFGTIHKALVKELYKRGIDSDILDWEIPYSLDEFKSFNDIYDCFITCVGGGVHFLNSCYNVSYDKIIGMAHGREDITSAIKDNVDISKLKKYAGISKDLYLFSKSLNINREMTILQNGIDFNNFYFPIAKKLNRIGYAGVFQKSFQEIEDWKRGYLVKEIADKTNTELLICSPRYHLAMPEYYRNIDTVIVSSVENESCALPLMEAAACGRLPISARIGITQNFDNPPGIILPIENNEFVTSGIQIIDELKASPKRFQKLCKEAQDFAREYYDWSYVIDDWIKLIAE